jgi:hypothetical protein
VDACTTCGALPYTPCRRFKDGACVAMYPGTGMCPVGSAPCPGGGVDIEVSQRVQQK